MALNNSKIPIKKLKEPVKINLIQYECSLCKKKSYINQADYKKEVEKCLFCNGETKRSRIFNIEIKGIGEY